MPSPIIIAIDGHSACGKSTLARDLASRLGIHYLDSGALYRAVCLYCLDLGIHPEDRHAVIHNLDGLEIQISLGDYLKVMNNGQEVTERIRLPEVTRWVSEISVVPEVRRKVNEILRRIGKQQSLVMDRRDIGTVVFPDASVKFFLTADKMVRAQRRQNELQSMGREISLEKVLENLEHRDTIDSTREDSPLRCAEDAVLIDNTLLDRSEQLELAMSYIRLISS